MKAWIRIQSFLEKNKTIALIFSIGLFFKLLVMPFAMHADLLSMNFRAHLLTEYGAWQLPTSQYLSHLVYAGNLLVMKLAGWDLASLFPLPFGLRPGSLTASVGNWLVFQNLPQINQVLFWWKIPHLLADIAVFWALARLFARSKQQRLVLALWWLNPVNFYAFYVFARHDAFTALFMLVALWLTAKHKLLPAILALFAAIQVRTQPLLLAPLFVVAWWKDHSFMELMKKSALAAGAIGLYLLVVNALPMNTTIIGALTGQANAGSPVKAFSVPGGRFSDEVINSAWGGLPIFLIVYAALGAIFLLFSQPKKSVKRLEFINAWVLVVMALYFAINRFSPHYFVWLSIFWTIGAGFKKQLIWPYVGALIGWLLMGAMATDSFSINQNLFLPLAPGLFRTPQLPVILASRGVDPAILFQVGRMILSLALLILAWRTWVASIRPHLSWSINWRKILKPGLWLSLLLVGALTQPKVTQAISAPVWEQQSGEQLIYLVPNQPIQQTFVSPVEQFGALEIQFASDRLNSSQQVIFRLKQADDQAWWYEGRLNRDDFYDRAYYPVGFPVVTGAMGRGFVFELELTPTADDHWTAVIGSNQDINFRVLSDRTQLFKQQTLARLRQNYATQPVFWWFYGGLLSIVATVFILLLCTGTKK